MRESTVTIPGRFCGPTASANGGYASGLVAELLGEPAEVELRKPPPLETPLAAAVDAGGVEVTDEAGGLVLRGRALGEGEPAVDVPEAVSGAQAQVASERYVGFTEHPFPRCVTCGPERDEGDGLRIFPGQVEGRPDGTVAAPWWPHSSVAAEDVTVSVPVVWASLDCPTGFTLINADAGSPPSVLARFAVRVDAPVYAERPHVVMGWPLGDDGRKHYAASALFDEHGSVVARASALWIQLRR